MSPIAALALLLCAPTGAPADPPAGPERPPALHATGGPAAAPRPGALDRAVARSIEMERFHAEIRVFRTGAIEVTEILRPRFTGSWRGIYRDIPVRYRTETGFDHRLFLSVEDVRDEADRPLRHEVSREGDDVRIRIWIPGARDATRTVVLTYRVENALRFTRGSDDPGEPGYDELYWNVTGTEWPFPIRNASAAVHLPVDVTGLRARAWTGGYGERGRDARLSIEGPVVRVETGEPLDYHEGLTVAVAWDPGVVRRPSVLKRITLFLRANWPLSLPLLGFLGMLRLWQLRGRDPRTRPITPRYEPPDDLTPGEVGVLVDHSPDLRDVTATLVDLAVRGHLVIEEREREKLLGLATELDYVFRRRTEPEAWSSLRPHERRLLEALFEDGRRERVRLEDLEEEFYTELPAIRDGLFTRLLDEEHYLRRPDRVRAGYIGAAVVVGVLLTIGGMFLADRTGLSGVTVVTASILMAVIVAGFGWLMPARTRKGTRVLEKILGFEEFLERVEEDRFRRMIDGPETFERYLPFALALGVEKRWARAFADLYTRPPEWYRGGDPASFRAPAFAGAMSDLSRRTGAAMSSSPRSSGGSGFSGGGGSSGGGFGGGGGGGF